MSRHYIEVTETIRYTVPLEIPDTITEHDTDELENLLLDEDNTNDVTAEADPFECLERSITITGPAEHA